jgi:hypothetical protein
MLMSVCTESPMRSSHLAPLQRCSSVHSVWSGSWIGTLVCCVRPKDHRGDHSASLGDVGTACYWQAIWQ